MTEQTIPTDQARRARQWARDTLDDVENGANVSAYARDAARTLIAMMPRPTLEDMTDEERAACQWMQADVANHRVRYVIATPDDGDGEATLIGPDGKIEWVFPEYVTPRPDLPRMEWPGTGQDGEEATKVDYVSVAGGRTAYGPWTVARLRKKPAPAPALPDGWRLANHPGHGSGIVTTPTPNSDGRVCFAIPSGSPLGYSWHLCYPYELTYIDTDQGADAPDAVPPNTLAEGSEWLDSDALARACRESGRDQIVVTDKDGDVFVWGADAEWWEAGLPERAYAPYTITHTGRKANQ